MGARRKVIIGLRLEGIIGRRILSGVLQYLDSAGDWDIQFAYGAHELKRLAPTADGILADHLVDEAGFAPSELAQIPVVHFNTQVPAAAAPRHAYVRADNGAIGFAAAEYLTGLGAFRSYAFIPAHHDKFWSVARERAFVLRLRKDGLDCRIYARATSAPRDDLTCLLDLRFRELEGRSVGASILAGNMQLFLPDLCQIHIACQNADLVQSRLTKIVSRHGL